MEQLSDLLTNTNEFSTLTVRLFVVLFVVVLERNISISASYHPGSLWQFLAVKLAKKTKKRASKQQYISGIISSIILLTTALIVVYSILSFALYPWFFEAIFLLLALNSNALLRNCQNVYRSLSLGKKNLAREQLNKVCIRDTHSLSVMGIVKSNIEGAIQQFSLYYFTPMMVYIIAGPYFLAFYALTNALAHYWNPKKQQYRFFGRLVSSIIGVVSLPFHCLLALLIAIIYGFKHLSIKRNSWHRFGTGTLLTTTANAMNRELGGAVMYDGIKIRRVTLGTEHHPQISDLKDLIRLIKRLQQSVLVIITLSTLFSVLAML
jgi:adenosylcobinamide-phosphate synthase